MGLLRRDMSAQQLAAIALYWLAIPGAVILGGLALDRAFGWARFRSGVGVTFCAATLLGTGVALIQLSTRDLRLLGEGTPSPALPPRRLVRRGTYGVCRHPMFLGYDLAALGVLLVVASPAALLVAYPALLFFQILFLRLKEERALERRFGEEYRDYRRRVPFLLPGCKACRRLS